MPRKSPAGRGTIVVERVQTGLRIEKRILKVLKAMAEYYEITLGDLVEGIVLHAFEGKTAFQRPSLERIKAIKKVYDLELTAKDSHHLVEREARGTKRARS